MPIYSECTTFVRRELTLKYFSKWPDKQVRPGTEKRMKPYSNLKHGQLL